MALKRLPPGLWRRGDVYYARFTINGRDVRRRLSRDLKTARQLLNDLRARADRGDYGITDNDYPWADLKREFLAWARQSLRPVVAEGYARDLARLESYLPLHSVRQIIPSFVIGYREWRLAQARQTSGQRPVASGRRVSPRTVNREVGTLLNLLNKGVAWQRIGANPIAGLKPLRHDQLTKRRRALTVAEVEALFAHSPEHLRPVWRLFLTTGIRKNELVSLRFTDVDFDRKTLTVRADVAKNHQAREIVLDENVLADIRRLAAEAPSRQPVGHRLPRIAACQREHFSRDHIFVTTANTPWRNNLIRRFYAIARRARIADATPGGAVDLHSLRVTFTTLALDHGANPKAVQAILGHSTLGLTMGVYARATEKAKRDAVAALPFARVEPPEHVVSLPLRQEATRRTTGAQPETNEAQTQAV